ncbi:MAG: hypothetical protein ABWX84_14810 [Nocardioides sp.]
MALLRPVSPRIPRGRAALGVLAAVFLLTLTGCGDDTRDTSGDTVGDDPSATAESPAATESTDPSAAASDTAEATPSSDPADTGLEGRLLTADELAGVNDETTWTVASTGPEDGATTGSCQRFDFVSLGANEAVRRTFTSNQDTVEAEQVVAEFADAKSAWRAHQVLKKWRTTCADQVDAADVKVGDLQSLKAGDGFADSYVVRYGDAGAEEQHWDGAGISRRGPFLSLVEIGLVGQDYNYPAGEEPASLAAKSALADLG